MATKVITACTGSIQTGGTSRKCLMSWEVPSGLCGDFAEMSCSMKGAAAEALLELEQLAGTHGSGGSAVTPRELCNPGGSATGTVKKDYAANPPSTGQVVFNEYTKTGYTWRISKDVKPGTLFSIWITATSDIPVCCRAVWGEKS